MSNLSIDYHLIKNDDVLSMITNLTTRKIMVEADEIVVMNPWAVATKVFLSKLFLISAISFTDKVLFREKIEKEFSYIKLNMTTADRVLYGDFLDTLQMYCFDLVDGMPTTKKQTIVIKNINGTTKIEQKNSKISEPKPQNDLIYVQTQKNLGVISSLKGEKYIRSYRLKLAIFRLYRYCNKTPQEISKITDIKEATVRNIIGSVFKKLCLSDEKCVFKNMLTPSNTNCNQSVEESEK
jgi:hypothetical protein